jgi:hypothetical protein
MRLLFLISAVCALTALNSPAASEQIIKQRAKDLRDQNNANQGVTPAARNSASGQATPAPAAVPVTKVTLTPQQQRMVRLHTSLLAIKPGSTPTSAQKEQLARDLMAAVSGADKPSTKNVARLSDELCSVLSKKLLARPTQSRLLQNLNGVLNPGAPSAPQPQGAIADVQALFESNGIAKKDAEAVAAALKAVAAETQKSASK